MHRAVHNLRQLLNEPPARQRPRQRAADQGQRNESPPPCCHSSPSLPSLLRWLAPSYVSLARPPGEGRESSVRVAMCVLERPPSSVGRKELRSTNEAQQARSCSVGSLLARGVPVWPFSLICTKDGRHVAPSKCAVLPRTRVLLPRNPVGVLLLQLYLRSVSRRRAAARRRAIARRPVPDRLRGHEAGAPIVESLRGQRVHELAAGFKRTLILTDGRRRRGASTS